MGSNWDITSSKLENYIGTVYVTGDEATEGSVRLTTNVSGDLVYEVYTLGVWVENPICGPSVPGGVDKTIQFNNSGVLDGNTKFVYDEATDTVTLSSTTNANLLIKADTDNSGEDDVGTLEIHQDGSFVVARFGNNGQTDRFVGARDNSTFIEAQSLSKTSYIQFVTGGAPGADDGIARMSIADTGEIGIGIVTSQSLLHVYENTANVDATAGITIEQDGTGDAILQYLLTGGQRWVMGIDNSENDTFKIASTEDLGINARLSILTGGNVGVGTPSPASPLHIRENTTTQGTGTGVTIEQEGTGDAILHFLLLGGQRYVMGIDNSDADTFKIATSNLLDTDTALSIDTSGNVTVTTQLAGDNSTKIATTAYVDNAVSVEDLWNRSGTTVSPSTAGDIVSTTGDVGAGILVPVSPLHVYENTTSVDATAGLTIEQDGTGDSVLQFLLTGGQRWVMGIDNNENDTFKISSTEDLGINARLSILTNGHVGIGEPAPISPLHIRENTSTTGNTNGVTIEQEGTGDAILHLLLSGGQRYVMGIDNSDADKFKLSTSNFLDTDTALTIDTTGNANFKNSISTPYGGLGQIQNLLKWSEDTTNAVWSDTVHITKTADQAIAPDGTTTADEWVYAGTTGIITRQNSLTLTPGNTYTLSFWARAVTTQRTVSFDLGDGASQNITVLVTNDLQRYSTQLVAGSQPWLDINNFSATTGTIYVWGFQLNEGTELLPYAKTEAIEVNVSAPEAGLIVNGKAIISESLGVGIGVDLPISPFHVYENTTNVDATAGLTIEQDGTGDSVLQFLLTGGQRWVMGVDNSENDTFKISSTENLGISARLSILTGGNVGIGTPLPTSTLHIRENTTAVDTTAGLTIEQEGTGDALLQFDLLGAQRYVMGIDNSDSDIFKIATSTLLDTDTAFTIIPSGKVGIKTNDPQSWLHVYENTTTNGRNTGITIEQNGTGDAILQFLLTLGTRWTTGIDNGDSDKFKFSSTEFLNTDTVLTLDTTGKVGVGIASPISQFHVYEDTTSVDATAGLTIEQDGTGDAVLQYLLTGGQRWVMGVDNSATDAFKIASSEDLGINARLTILTNGNVGVGEPSPVSPLHIRETTSTTGNTNGVTIQQDGTGDVNLHFLLLGGQRYVMGIDNSDADTFKIATSNLLDTDTALSIETGGRVRVFDALNFDPITSPTHVEGNVYYDSVDKSLSYQTSSSGVTMNIGKEIFVPPQILNDQGVAITNGQAVYISGSNGTYPEVKLAQANAEATAMSVGLITETSISNGATGYCTTYGLVRNFNTASWATGDILYLSTTVAGGLQNTKPTYPNFAIRMGIVISSGASGTIFVTYPISEITEGSSPVIKSHSISDQGASDVVYLAGFYEAPLADTTLTIGGTVTQTYGSANGAHGAHAFVVMDTATEASLVLTVSGTSITDAGVLTAADSEVICSGVQDQNDYYETSKKWLGTITYTLTGTTGSYQFNYGFAKYDDYGNRPFTLVDFEMVSKSGVNATGQNIEVLHHRPANWTYSAAAFVPGPSDTIISMSDDYGANLSIFADEYFPYKRSGISQAINGSESEGLIIRVTQSTNNSVDFGTAHVGVLI